VLRFPQFRRGEKEIAFLKLAFSSFKLFQELEDELPPQVFNELFLDLKYESMQKGETVFNFGKTVIGRMFFILSSMFFVWICR
jgi:hypothetical protein